MGYTRQQTGYLTVELDGIIMTISKVKRLEIANCMYGNVSGLFAYCTNTEHRSPNFKWSVFTHMVKGNCNSWWWIYCGQRKITGEESELVKQYATEIATTLLQRAGINENG